MKKIFAVLFLSLSLFLFPSCKNAINLEMYLSEIRSSCYQCVLEDYSVTVYAEEKESPYLADGFVAEMKKYVTVKIEGYRSALSDASVTVKYGDNSYHGKFEYSPLNGKFITEMEVESLPTVNEIEVTVKNNGEEKTFKAVKVTKQGALSYKSALDKVAFAKGKQIEKMLKGDGSSIEARVRILTEGDSVYYFVSITDVSGKTYAYLVDGQTGEIVAEKEF